ncbi:MAG TPA: putative toxin-antitoxin system toxin component, PIN family [Firmicutes bacterium]|nr:putative toxin-antitoxin system toxin component, PIN family [Bacillota bacterium]
MRVFLDTNVLVSAFSTRGLCADILREVLGAHELIVSEQVLSELRRILVEKFGVPNEIADEIDGFLREDSVFGDPEPLIDLVFDDKDDVPILSAAVHGNTKLFVTGDKAVHALGRIGAMRIYLPREFWNELRNA